MSASSMQEKRRSHPTPKEVGFPAGSHKTIMSRDGQV